MSLPIQPAAGRAAGSGPWSATGAGAFHDPNNFTEVFLGAFRRDVLSFYPGARIERENLLPMADPRTQGSRVSPTFSLDFQLHEGSGPSASVRVSLFGVWYRVSVPRTLGLGARDHELLRSIGRVMELHHQVLLRWSRTSLLRLRRGMPEDHYVAASLEPEAYETADSAPSRIAEAILTLRTMALSTYENRHVTTGALIVGHSSEGDPESTGPSAGDSRESLTFGVELTGLKSLHRLCDGRRTLFLVDRQRRLSEIVDIRQWAIKEALNQPDARESGILQNSDSPGTACEDDPDTYSFLKVPCARVYNYHALATRTGGHVCLVLSPNQEIKVFAGGVQAYVFAHGRWRVLDSESKFGLWEQAVGRPVLARVLFQTALDLAEERQGGLLVVVHDPAQAIGRLIAPHDVLEPPCVSAADRVGGAAVPADEDSPLRPFTLFGLNTASGPREGATDGSQSSATFSPSPTSPVESAPLTKRSLHYLARGLTVSAHNSTVLEALAGLDGALVTDPEGRLLALGAILRHDAHSLTDPDRWNVADAHLPEGARTTAALVASHFGPVLKISEDGIVSCFLNGERVWDL